MISVGQGVCSVRKNKKIKQEKRTNKQTNKPKQTNKSNTRTELLTYIWLFV
jgi:serine/threonine protein kinase